MCAGHCGNPVQRQKQKLVKSTSVDKYLLPSITINQRKDANAVE